MDVTLHFNFYVNDIKRFARPSKNVSAQLFVGYCKRDAYFNFISVLTMNLIKSLHFLIILRPE